MRVELNPTALFNYGIGLEDVRAALASANANTPKGAIDDGDRRYQIYANDQGRKAADYRDLVVAYRNGAAVRLSDVAQVHRRRRGHPQPRPRQRQARRAADSSTQQPGANIIETVDAVKAGAAADQAALPGGIDLELAGDRTATIRASLRGTERTLLIAVGLVILVVFAFLRNWRATLIPAVAVPVSLIGTFGGDVPARLLARQPLADGADHRAPASWSTTPSW